MKLMPTHKWAPKQLMEGGLAPGQIHGYLA
jgi:hypothetical protein